MKKLTRFLLCLMMILISIKNLDALSSSTGVITQAGNHYIDSQSSYGMAVKYSESLQTAYICVQYDKTTPAGKSISCSITSDWDQKTRYAVAKLIQASGLSKSNKTTEGTYFNAELALNKFLYEKTGGVDGASNAESQLGEEYSNLKNVAYNAYNSYPNPTASFSGSLNFKKSGDNYVSDSVTINSDFNVDLTSSHGTINRSGNTFTVSVPSSSINSSTTVTVTATPTASVVQARKYDCTSSYQALTPIDYDTITISGTSAKVTGAITPLGTIIINKLGKNNVPLTGATIQITGPNNYSKTFTTNGNTVTISDLEYGSYTIREISAPVGYSIIKEVTANLSSSNLSQTINLKDELTKVKISKKDLTGNNELSGAILEVQDENGNIVNFCTDIDGNQNKECKWVSTNTPYEIEGLPVGIYYLIETKAPDRYVLSKEKIKFEVKNDGSVTEVKMKNKLNKVIISKVNSVDKKQLPGAVLEIQDENGNIVNFCTDLDGNKNKECKWKSTDKPYEIEGLPNGIYYLVETLAPEGYVLSADKVKFEVDGKEDVINVEMINNLEIKVPDTLSSKSALLFAIAMFDIALGIGIVTYVKKNKIEQ